MLTDTHNQHQNHGRRLIQVQSCMLLIKALKSDRLVGCVQNRVKLQKKKNPRFTHTEKRLNWAPHFRPGVRTHPKFGLMVLISPSYIHSTSYLARILHVASGFYQFSACGMGGWHFLHYRPTSSKTCRCHKLAYKPHRKWERVHSHCAWDIGVLCPAKGVNRRILGWSRRWA